MIFKDFCCLESDVTVCPVCQMKIVSVDVHEWWLGSDDEMPSEMQDFCQKPLT